MTSPRPWRSSNRCSTGWLERRTSSSQDDRKSYRTWQYQGRQVLTLRVGAGDEVELVAGVELLRPEAGTRTRRRFG